MLQNATPLRKSAPGPPKSSDEHVSCTAPATGNASLQILFKCPTPAIVFWTCYKTLTFLLTFDKVPQSLAPATRKQHLNVQKWSKPLVVLLTFWLRNMLRATTAWTFYTSQFPKVVREWCVLYMLTSKCASRHNGVHFFDISTSKSGPELRCFLCILTWKCASRHNGVQFVIARSAPAALASLLFDPLEPQIIGKNTVFRDFPTFLRTCIFFLLTLSLLWSSLFCSSLLYSSAPPLLFICAYCRKFGF